MSTTKVGPARRAGKAKPLETAAPSAAPSPAPTPPDPRIGYGNRAELLETLDTIGMLYAVGIDLLGDDCDHDNVHEILHGLRSVEITVSSVLGVNVHRGVRRTFESSPGVSNG